MNRCPLTQDVILNQHGSTNSPSGEAEMFVADDLGRVTSMRPRCQMCKFAVIDENAWIVRCKREVDKCAEINKKCGVR